MKKTLLVCLWLSFASLTFAQRKPNYLFNEWTNLAKDKRYAAVKKDHARWLPKTNLPAVAGSAQRLLEQVNGV